ncbi:porin [Sulfurimonas microaerophilic]|uniref:porin n=1 Tax=Sulfurimonas microaerophilic TaxID=3058392 RepID=UPI0027154243|nr:porin [Sulfurimonas sp. hsl 1-7]
MKLSKKALSLVAFSLLTTATFADTNQDIEALKAEIQELREITQTLADETSSLKTGVGFNVVDTTQSYSGLASAASKVYYSKSPLSIGGYGEMFYAYNKEDGKSLLDVYRFVPYIGYRFSDNIILNAELEFEHGGAEDGNTASGYVVVEFMYLDFLINDYANIRAGHMLVPMGLINERHEPTLFTTVQRPQTEKYIIPSTWHDSGVMVYGQVTDNLSYKLAAISALKTEADGKSWIRDGRGGSFKQTDPNLGFVARMDYTGINGLLVGASVYNAPSGDETSSRTTISDLHLDYKQSGFRLYGVYSQVDRSDAEDINATAVESAYGGYLNASFDILSLTNSSDMLPLFVQYEQLSPQDKLADGTGNESTKITTVGLNYFPHEQVVIKFDHAMQKGGFGDSDTTSISLGFIF